MSGNAKPKKKMESQVPIGLGVELAFEVHFVFPFCFC
jgi:hypothetical protein